MREKLRMLAMANIPSARFTGSHFIQFIRSKEEKEKRRCDGIMLIDAPTNERKEKLVLQITFLVSRKKKKRRRKKT